MFEDILYDSDKPIKHTEHISIFPAMYLSQQVVVKLLKIKKVIGPELDLDKVNNCLFWSEVYFTKLMSETRSPHFPQYIYHCTSLVEEIPRLVLVTRHAGNQTMNDYFRTNGKKMRYSDMSNFYFQLTMAISVMLTNNLIHGDLHADNIIITEIPRDSGSFEYQFKGVSYWAPNIIKRVVILDFGFAHSPGKIEFPELAQVLGFQKTLDKRFIDLQRIVGFLNWASITYELPSVGHYGRILQRQLDSAHDIESFINSVWYCFLDKLPNSKLILGS